MEEKEGPRQVGWVNDQEAPEIVDPLTSDLLISLAQFLTMGVSRSRERRAMRWWSSKRGFCWYTALKWN